MNKNKELYNIYKDSKGISTDTRSIEDGQLFFALKGDRFDAGLFVEEALQKGADHVVTQNTKYLNCQDVTVVDDVLVALQKLANYHRHQLQGKIIGLTGSNGKTTTKELLYEALSCKFNVFKTSGNLNNHIGVPISLLSVTKEHEIAIIEMGANKIGDIKELVEIADPDYGFITNIGTAHIEGFGSKKGVFEGKTEMYRHIEKTKGTLFVNYKDKLLADYAKTLHVNRSFYNKEASHIVEGVGPEFSIQLERNNQKFSIQPKLFGSFNAQNYICAADIAIYFGVPAQESVTALSKYVSKIMRSELIYLENYTIFMDAYNANPSSMKASITSFLDISPKVSLILGDMKEMGEHALMIHQEMIDFIAQYSWNRVDLIGPDFHACNTDFHTYENVESYLQKVDFKDLLDSQILIKGSRSIKLEQVLDRIKNL